MTIEEAIHAIKNEILCVSSQTEQECHRDCEECSLALTDETVLTAYDMAISALRAQQEAEKNEPLTLEDLKGMEGKPVFWKSLISPHCGEWRILNHFGEKMEYLDFSGKSPEMFCNYGKWYVCYRHPPKEAHNV